MAIITISRQVGSLGDEIAQAVADALGYRYVEKSQISEALSNVGFSLSEIDKYDEKVPSIWQSLSIQKDQFAHLIQAVVYELAARNNAVIVGRGGQAILKGIPGTLHVRIIAPHATRLSRIMEDNGYDEKNARQVIRQNDRDSAGYLSTYFNTNWNNSDLYDLVINTSTITPNESVQMISCAAGNGEIKKVSPKSELLHDLALAHKAKSALLNITEKVDRVELEFDKGVAYLSGLVRSSVIKNKCEQAILNIQGVESVNNHLNVRDKTQDIF